MNQADTEKKLQADPELDAVLEQMSGEVPPMPADFHGKWMNAIRAEAKQNAPVAEEKEEKKPAAVVRWTRILSVAAMFVFLIGGTLLYRNTKGSLMPALNAAKQETAVMTEMAVMAAGETDTMSAEETTETKAEAKRKDAGALTLGASALKEAEAVDSASEAEAYADNEAPAMAMDAVMKEAAEAEYEAAEEPMPVPAATAMPTKPVYEPAGAETVDEPDAAEPEQSGWLQQAGEFFTDMGDFLLAALPYLAVLAVPAVIALLLRQKKKQK